MAAIALMLGALWFVLLWYQMVHYLPAQRAIVGCRHQHGKVMECAPDIRGRPCILVWFCDTCPFQAPLQMHCVGRTHNGDTAIWVVTKTAGKE